MTKDQVTRNINKDALLGNSLVTILEFKQGWVTVQGGEGEPKKVRAKDLLMKPGGDDEKDVPKPEKAKVLLDGTSTKKCSCGEDVIMKENSRCKGCGKMHWVKLHPNMENYAIGLAATASGRDTVDIDDDIAGRLRSLPVDELYTVAEKILSPMDIKCALGKGLYAKFKKSETDAIGDFLFERYAHLNNGMQRMNIGNLIRGAQSRCAKSTNGEK